MALRLLQGLALLMTASAVLATLPTSHAGGAKFVLPIHASTCNGRVGECIDPGQELLMDSEMAKRQLWDRSRYISYEAMKKNNVPCGKPGQSYYNCQGNGAANPYRRGCTAITNCARTW